MNNQQISRNYTISTDEAMQQLGGALAHICVEAQQSCLLYFHGDLGVGKTTFIRGFIRSLGYEGIIKSPTYTLVEPYEVDGQKIYHFDLYRVHSPYECEEMGIRDYLHDAICLIEWPEKGEGCLPSPQCVIEIDITPDEKRSVKMVAMDALGEQLLSKMREQ